MEIEVKIRTTQPCPECKGEKEIHNSEYVTMTAAYDAWKLALGRRPTPAEDNDWTNNYWRAQGYGTNDRDFVTGPWDVRRCNHCAATGTTTRSRYVGLAELARLTKNAVAEYNIAYVPETGREVPRG